MEKKKNSNAQKGISFHEIKCIDTDFDSHMPNDKEISYKEIEELIEGGIIFTKNRLLIFAECEQMEQ